MKSVQTLLSKKIFTYTLPLMLLAGLVSMNFLSQQKDRHQSLNEGIYTCFTRVGQTYTAKLLNHQNSPYLQDDFTKTTQECLAEGLELAQSISLFRSIKIRHSLNNLASETHWLHQNFKSSEGVASKFKGAENGPIALNSRFATLEKMRDTTVDLIDDQVATISSYQTAAAILTFSFAALTTFLFWSMGITNRAEAIYPKSKSKKAEELLTEDIPIFNPLFSPFKSKSDMMDEVGVLATHEPDKSVSDHKNATKTIDETLINVGETFEKVLNYVTTELKDKSIQLKFDSNANSYYVKAHTDTMEHILFNTMVCLMKMAVGTEENKTQIKVENRMLGENLSLRIISGKSAIGVNAADISKDFAIIKGLAADEGIQFVFEESSEQFIFAFVFSKVAIIEAAENVRRLSLVKKGKKRDLTREFQN